MAALLFLINQRETVHPVPALFSKKDTLSIGSHTDLGLAEICGTMEVPVEILKLFWCFRIAF